VDKELRGVRLFFRGEHLEDAETPWTDEPVYVVLAYKRTVYATGGMHVERRPHVVATVKSPYYARRVASKTSINTSPGQTFIIGPVMPLTEVEITEAPRLDFVSKSNLAELFD
jgi:hypothetical protein